jgi:alanyl-tRNA synthetase
MMPELDGRGGGNADMAQGGGTNVKGIDAALKSALEAVRGKSK